MANRVTRLRDHADRHADRYADAMKRAASAESANWRRWSRGRPPTTQPSQINSNNGFGLAAGNAGYPLVDQVDTNRESEAHYSSMNADGYSATEWYQYENTGARLAPLAPTP